jgi:hypothetical protein
MQHFRQYCLTAANGRGGPIIVLVLEFSSAFPGNLLVVTSWLISWIPLLHLRRWSDATVASPVLAEWRFVEISVATVGAS